MTWSRMLLPVFTIALVSCGGAESGAVADAASEPVPDAATSDLTAEELEQGIGPIRDLALADIDAALAAEGEEAFLLKCSACHKVEERYIGPELAGVLARRRPEFVMNMMLNANEMVARHPGVREMLAEYFTPMPVQGIDEPEARAILEYLRSVQQ